MCLYMHRNGAACCILKERRVDSFHSGLRPAATTVKVQDMQPAARQLLQFLIKDLEATKNDIWTERQVWNYYKLPHSLTLASNPMLSFLPKSGATSDVL